MSVWPMCLQALAEGRCVKDNFQDGVPQQHSRDQHSHKSSRADHDGQGICEAWSFLEVQKRNHARAMICKDHVTDPGANQDSLPASTA